VAFDHRASADGLGGFKACIARCPFVDVTTEVTGTFDLIVEGRCASLAEFNEQMDLIRPQIAQFVSRIETNFVSKKVERVRNGDAGALWLPFEGGRKRVEAHMIDKIEAEGDYMRIHVADWCCLVHDTMHRLSELLADAGFALLNRSCLVRLEFIDRLIHEERRWVARLADGAHVRIAKSHVAEVLRLTSGESSKLWGPSSTNGQSAQEADMIIEKRMKARA
jgi:DNA-binding LytR/AlgR family response regulator